MQSIQNTGKSGYLNGPQYTFNDEARMAKQARQKIGARLRLASMFQKYRAQLVANKHDVTVTSDPPSTEEKICITVYENKKVVPLTVTNSGAKMVYFTFHASEFVKDTFTVRDCHGNVIKKLRNLPLGPGEAFKIQVHFYSEDAGFYEQLLAFRFESFQQSSACIQIMRLLEVIHRTSLSEEPLPTSTNSLRNLQIETVDEGVKMTWLRPVVPLKGYPMPEMIKDVDKCETDLEKTPLKWKNYTWRFKLLLHVEEHNLKKEIEKFNQDAPMFRHKSNRNLLTLQITGVSHISPSRLTGNMVLVTPLDQPEVFENTLHKGLVQHVDAEQVCLHFGEKFLSQFKEGMRFHCNFALNRLPLRTQHRAAELVNVSTLKEVLFPTGKFSSHSSYLPRLLELENNPEQSKAVQHILAATAKPAPYLVFGPPGTGKTVTMVETIKQIMKTQPSCRILVCAPSNGATDHFCEKILEGMMGEHRVYRLYALSCSVRNIPENIKPCCNLDLKTNALMIPPKAELMRQKIMVTSLLTAGRLVTGGIPADHYSYMFVDEAGQAAETECIIPIAGLLNSQKCQVVLAGDPKQLGPIITSRVAAKNGMGVSLLERLMNDSNLYKSQETQGFNNRFVTKLLRNYRSHPAILKIPNELFYNGELKPYGDKATCNSYCQWEHLPKKGFPLIFHGVAGTDEREGNSPSVYNMAEVEVVKKYLKALIAHLQKKEVTKIEPGEIGIIAPYRKQVEKIQNALLTDKDLREKNLENILVGSVEQFQGKEFNVILMSTVRSNPKLTAKKQRFTLGFVDNEKRFNVAMTRARALLIVVGDPRVLKTDDVWNKFIHYCFTEGGYRGITVSNAKKMESDTATSEPLMKEPTNDAQSS